MPSQIDPGRIYQDAHRSTLRHSDYAATARALGLHGERVDKPEELAPALQRALKNAPARQF